MHTHTHIHTHTHSQREIKGEKRQREIERGERGEREGRERPNCTLHLMTIQRHCSCLTPYIPPLPLKVSDSHLEAQLSSKICCFKLVEVAYTRLSALDLNSSESQLNEAYNGGDKKTGKELTKAATKCIHMIHNYIRQD